jgi:hypothetical protein
MRYQIAALMTAVGTLVGCAGVEDEESVELEGAESGKDDSILGKRLTYSVRAEWSWNDGTETMNTDSEVLSRTDTSVRVRALRIAFDLQPDDVVDLSVDAVSFNDLGDLSTDMAFLLFARSGRGPWQLARCDGQSYFQSAVVDAAAREIDVRTLTGPARTLAWDDCGIDPATTAVGLFPFPSSNWFGLKGYYHLEVEASCNSDTCRGPR